VRARRRGERGSAALELVIVAPALLLVLGLVIAGGRLSGARQGVATAAGDAARAASVARGPTDAQAAATASASAALGDEGLACAPLSVTVDTTDFVPGGSVGVTVGCTAQLGTLVPGALSGTHEVHAHASAVIDTYRGVGGP